AADGDDIKMSVNYARVCADITNWMKDNRCRLIETVAQKLAEKLLFDLPVVRRAEVTVKKPWAPIGLPVQCVSITVERGWHTVYLSIGSNRGDRKKYLDDGIGFLKNDKRVRVILVSDYIETKPYGKEDQDDFLNGAVKIETILSPDALLALLHDAENAAGRKREVRWGPRTLDMDILLYDDLVLNTPDLVIPHSDMANRDFVLRPLSQIAPEAFHPILQKSIASMIKD
ncbi:MAG: 2-amino-4-hydroxy-6-hydroxymethyldihydropteridine diphosphokinase, partial [Lachnospiraceae bacterium]|nr:2-amino-4-hydroxy-6-hydroxymethyldihydropteridine diphosphokinase [Lachnospiraceae bacterium]